MRLYLRTFITYTLTLYILIHLFPFIVITPIQNLPLVGLAFLVCNFFFRPILKLVLLPFNIVTLGLFSWVIHVITVFIVTILVPGFHVYPAFFPHILFGRFSSPAFSLSQFWTYLFFAFAFSILNGLMEWALTKRS